MVLERPEKVVVKGIRTYLGRNSDSFKEVECTFEFKQYDNKYLEYDWWCSIVDGGVTGYESFCISKVDLDETEKTKERMLKDGWSACAGTEGRWDRLFIPADSMKEIYNSWERQKHVKRTVSK
jgi:hypothetical protein